MEGAEVCRARALAGRLTGSPGRRAAGRVMLRFRLELFGSSCFMSDHR